MHQLALLALIAAVFTAAYYVSVRRHPYRPCRPCGGKGRNPGSTSKRFGRCGYCGGSGRKLRLGAWLLERRRGR
jgi:DnaJ-class molecular chaperone